MNQFFECQRKMVFIYILLFASITMTSCTAIGAFSKGHSFQGKYAINLDKPSTDILAIIEEVGKSMSLKVSQLDTEQGTIALSSGASVDASYLYGKYGSRTIIVKSLDSGKKLEVEISLFGNFGTGEKESADKLFNDFKLKLLEKISS